MRKANLKETRKLCRTTRELLRTINRPDLLPATRDGVGLLNYILDATKAAQKQKAPFPGLAVDPVVITGTSKRFARAAEVSKIMSDAIEQGMKSLREKGLNKL